MSNQGQKTRLSGAQVIIAKTTSDSGQWGVPPSPVDGDEDNPASVMIQPKAAMMDMVKNRCLLLRPLLICFVCIHKNNGHSTSQGSRGARIVVAEGWAPLIFRFTDGSYTATRARLETAAEAPGV